MRNRAAWREVVVVDDGWPKDGKKPCMWRILGTGHQTPVEAAAPGSVHGMFHPSSHFYAPSRGRAMQRFWRSAAVVGYAQQHDSLQSCPECTRMADCRCTRQSHVIDSGGLAGRRASGQVSRRREYKQRHARTFLLFVVPFLRSASNQRCPVPAITRPPPPHSLAGPKPRPTHPRNNSQALSESSPPVQLAPLSTPGSNRLPFAHLHR